MLYCVSQHNTSYATAYVHQMAYHTTNRRNELVYGRFVGKPTFVKAIAANLHRGGYIRVSSADTEPQYIYGQEKSKCLYHKVGNIAVATYYSGNLFSSDHATSIIIGRNQEELDRAFAAVLKRRPICFMKSWPMKAILDSLQLITDLETYNIQGFEVTWPHEQIQERLSALVRTGKLTFDESHRAEDITLEDLPALPSESDIITEGPWAGFEVISTYTRAQAIEDGVLVDVTETAKEAGFKFPVAVTSELWGSYIEPTEADRKLGQDTIGRLWDVLNVLRFTIKSAKDTDQLFFKVIFLIDSKQQTVKIKSHCGPGDNAEPVITLMLPWED